MEKHCSSTEQRRGPKGGSIVEIESAEREIESAS